VSDGGNIGLSPPLEIFVSHSSDDRKFVEKLCGELRRHGVPFWYSKRNILGAQQWHDQIGSALARCDWIAVVLSPKAVRSKWVKHELLYALNDARYENHIIPCVYRKCDINQLSWTLSSFQWVSFSSDFERGMRELFKIWGMGYKTAPAAITTKSKTSSKRGRRSRKR